MFTSTLTGPATHGQFQLIAALALLAVPQTATADPTVAASCPVPTSKFDERQEPACVPPACPCSPPQVWSRNQIECQSSPQNGLFLSFSQGATEFDFPGLVAVFGVFSRPTCRGQLATDLGTPGSDNLVGTKGRDVIVAYGGSDTVLGGGGPDLVCGGGGPDKLKGHDGSDVLVGGPGNDTCAGGSGGDSIRGCGSSLFGEDCEGTLINSSSHQLYLTGRSKKKTDTWGIEPLPNFNIGANGGKLTWRSDAPAFRGCENQLTFTVSDDGGATSLGTITANLEKDYVPLEFKGAISCKSSSSRFSCSQVSADKDPQGLDLDVTWNVAGS